MQETKLSLGGHSFIGELGNDPHASFPEQCAIVAACIDSGIDLIDTTYYQERLALGRVLKNIPYRRDEIRITAWNFFRQLGKENELTGFTPYGPDSLNVQLTELQTDYLDLLVIHTSGDRAVLERQFALAHGWRQKGLVREIGLGMARIDDITNLPADHPATAVLAPYNAFHTGAAPLFQEAKRRGMRTIAMSPFVRGWNLDRIGGDHRAAALLLRWVTAQASVDTVLVSMRRAEWVHANREAEKQGPLSEQEEARVRQWIAPSALA